VVHEYVVVTYLLEDGRLAPVPALGEPRVGLWRPLLDRQVWAVEVGQPRERPVIERPREVKHLVVVEPEFPCEEIHRVRWGVRLDVQTDDRRKASLLEQFLRHLDEVLGDLLVAFHLGVASHPEQRAV
jgi:hypothetical protein